jgi:RNA polymerase-interacting CarD/CdnL/TRCF family regulator
MRDLAVLNEKNTLRGSVKNLLESINKILIEEISFVQNISKARAQKLINDRLNKAAERAKCNRKK